MDASDLGKVRYSAPPDRIVRPADPSCARAGLGHKKSLQVGPGAKLAP